MYLDNRQYSVCMYVCMYVYMYIYIYIYIYIYFTVDYPFCGLSMHDRKLLMSNEKGGK